MSVRKTPRTTAVPATQVDWLDDLASQRLTAEQALQWLQHWSGQGLLRHLDSALAAQLLRLDPQGPALAALARACARGTSSAARQASPRSSRIAPASPSPRTSRGPKPPGHPRTSSTGCG